METLPNKWSTSHPMGGLLASNFQRPKQRIPSPDQSSDLEARHAACVVTTPFCVCAGNMYGESCKVNHQSSQGTGVVNIHDADVAMY